MVTGGRHYGAHSLCAMCESQTSLFLTSALEGIIDIASSLQWGKRVVQS